VKPLSLEIERIIDNALDEDLGHGDITTQSMLPPNLQAQGVMRAKKKGVIAGVDVAVAVFRRLDPSLRIDILTTDGIWVEPGTDIIQIEGKVAPILAGERVALNLLQRMSGIATLTARYVQAVSGTKARVIDTRKTTPGLRILEKYAVRVAGGFNHRFNLSDGILIKDNHLEAMKSVDGDLAAVLATVKRNAPHGMRVQVEVESLAAAREAVVAGADSLLLDNMRPTQIREVVRELGDRIFLEASGGITLETVREYAEAGVDVISVGALTHSAPALDISLDFEFSRED
jgi:nicotinate-nucleotide pyrophosphorylase (carboxylating)